MKLRALSAFLHDRGEPIEIAVARKNSGYWEATEAQTVDMALFFLKAATPHKLMDAPGGAKYFNNGNPNDPAYVARINNGKVVFAETCARCHSSKLPTPDTPKPVPLQCQPPTPAPRGLASAQTSPLPA